MDAAKNQTMRKFSGVNNVDQATRLPVVISDYEYIYPLRQANNVEIDNTYGLKSRSGYTSVKTGTDIHSMWADESIWLYVDGSTLYRLDPAYNTVSLRGSLQPGARMSYARFNDRVYYTNEFQIGYIDADVDYGLVNPSRNFKEPLPAGQFIEMFMGCLYVAKGDTLYISDPLCDYYDVRRGYRIFNERITMLRAVDHGLYVSDDRVWFVKGKGNEDFEKTEVRFSRAVPHTDIRILGKHIDDDISGNIAMWTGEDGICIGDNNGVVINLTSARYTFTERGRGAGFIREKNNVRHYINSLY